MNRKELANRLRELGQTATARPWNLRRHPRLPTFIQAQPANPQKLGYALEVFGEDYTGYGEQEQREKDLELSAFLANNLEAIIQILENPEITVQIQENSVPTPPKELPETDPLFGLKL
jgi:hypothetical protein